MSTNLELPLPCAPPGLIDDIQAANQKFMEAFAKQDATAVSNLYTTDCKIMPTGADVITGRGRWVHSDCSHSSLPWPHPSTQTQMTETCNKSYCTMLCSSSCSIRCPACPKTSYNVCKPDTCRNLTQRIVANSVTATIMYS